MRLGESALVLILEGNERDVSVLVPWAATTGAPVLDRDGLMSTFCRVRNIVDFKVFLSVRSIVYKFVVVLTRSQTFNAPDYPDNSFPILIKDIAFSALSQPFAFRLMDVVVGSGQSKRPERNGQNCFEHHP